MNRDVGYPAPGSPAEGHPPLEPEAHTGGGERPSRWRRSAWVVLGALFLVVQATPVALRAIGHWLVVEQELTEADAIFVHAGQVPFRAMQAADLYAQGLAGEVWHARVDPTSAERALEELGLALPPRHMIERRVLERVGVPRGAIQMLPEAVAHTHGEVRAVIAEMQRRGFDTIILVSAKQHTRRILILWERLAPEGMTAQVRGSDRDPYDPDTWWRGPVGGSAVLHELVGIVYALTGVHEE